MAALALAVQWPGPQYKQLKAAAAMAGVRVRQISPAAYGLSLADLRDGAPVTEADGAFDPLPEPMLLFADFTQAQFNAFLTRLHNQRVGTGVLKAVLTPTNARWTLPTLYRELAAERAAVTAAQQGDGTHE